MCKESSKPSKLSTKLSTIWQINDYLSKKIDNRLIVDIIDTRGHPAVNILHLSANQLHSWSVESGAVDDSSNALSCIAVVVVFTFFVDFLFFTRTFVFSVFLYL